jgi:CRISPR-associated endoribonuclease Cas6
MPHAFLLELIPFVQEASPLHFSLHTYGPFFALLGKIDLQRATEIHQAKRKPFTLIPLPDKHTLHFRVTTLDNALFAPFLEVLLEEAPCGLSFSPESLPPRRATDWRAGLPGRPAQAPPAQDLILLRFR